jgi:hypothetical protein
MTRLLPLGKEWLDYCLSVKNDSTIASRKWKWYSFLGSVRNGPTNGTTFMRNASPTSIPSSTHPTNVTTSSSSLSNCGTSQPRQPENTQFAGVRFWNLIQEGRTTRGCWCCATTTMILRQKCSNLAATKQQFSRSRRRRPENYLPKASYIPQHPIKDTRLS